MREELFTGEYELQQTEDQVQVSALYASNFVFTAVVHETVSVQR